MNINKTDSDTLKFFMFNKCRYFVMLCNRSLGKSLESGSHYHDGTVLMLIAIVF